MLENPVLTVAFVVLIVSFFKAQFGLAGKWALLAAFITALVLGLIPQLGLQFPALAPWLDAVAKVIALFLGAAGSFDFVKEVRTNYI